MATTVANTSVKTGRRKRWYAYLGGGAVDVEQTWLISGSVVLAKDWGVGSLHHRRVLFVVVLQLLWPASVG
eukprot:11169460-Lingulodinium_polyedra.AAC.1